MDSLPPRPSPNRRSAAQIPAGITNVIVIRHDVAGIHTDLPIQMLLYARHRKTTPRLSPQPRQRHKGLHLHRYSIRKQQSRVLLHLLVLTTMCHDSQQDRASLAPHRSTNRYHRTAARLQSLVPQRSADNRSFDRSCSSIPCPRPSTMRRMHSHSPFHRRYSNTALPPRPCLNGDPQLPVISALLQFLTTDSDWLPTAPPYHFVFSVPPRSCENHRHREAIRTNCSRTRSLSPSALPGPLSLRIHAFTDNSVFGEGVAVVAPAVA